MNCDQTRAVLDQVFKDRGIETSQIIRALTSTQPNFIEGFWEKQQLYFKKHFPQADPSVIRSFGETNRTQLPLEMVYGPLPELAIKTENELKSIFDVPNRQGWKAFREKYPNSAGIVALSHPGFSEDGTQCLLELGQQRDFLWGHGMAYLYSRMPSGWTKTTEHMTWIS